MNAFSPQPDITRMIHDLEVMRGLPSSNGAAVLKALEALSIDTALTALTVLEKFANTLSWSHGYDRIHDGIEEIREDLRGEASQ